MVKSRLVTIAILLCVSISTTARTQVVARTAKSTAATRQQALVKRINQGALRFYKIFIRQSARTTVTLDCELNHLLEDFLLAADSLMDPRYMRHNLIIVMQIASDVEQELLLADISSNVVLAWARLHADVDQLAKMNGIRWSEAVITYELIATLASDVDTVSKKVQTELSPFQAVSATTSADWRFLLSNFRSSVQELNNGPLDKLQYRIEAITNDARAINASINNYVVSSALQRDWRRVTSRLEELVRLYSMDSIELDRKSSQKIAEQN